MQRFRRRSVCPSGRARLVVWPMGRLFNTILYIVSFLNDGVAAGTSACVVLRMKAEFEPIYDSGLSGVIETRIEVLELPACQVYSCTVAPWRATITSLIGFVT